MQFNESKERVHFKFQKGKRMKAEDTNTWRLLEGIDYTPSHSPHPMFLCTSTSITEILLASLIHSFSEEGCFKWLMSLEKGTTLPGHVCFQGKYGSATSGYFLVPVYLQKIFILICPRLYNKLKSAGSATRIYIFPMLPCLKSKVDYRCYNSLVAKNQALFYNSFIVIKVKC